MSGLAATAVEKRLEDATGLVCGTAHVEIGRSKLSVTWTGRRSPDIGSISRGDIN